MYFECDSRVAPRVMIDARIAPTGSSIEETFVVTPCVTASREENVISVWFVRISEISARGVINSETSLRKPATAATRERPRIASGGIPP